MSARRHDNPLRWFVDSHSRTKLEHLVEIDAYDGNGACACEHFRFHIEPMLREGAEGKIDATRCHHILEARNELLDHIIEVVKEQQAKQMKEHRVRPEEAEGI